MATQPTTGLTYEDLARFPEDNFRRELIDGELIVTAAPSTRHPRSSVAPTDSRRRNCRVGPSPSTSSWATPRVRDAHGAEGQLDHVWGSRTWRGRERSMRPSDGGDRRRSGRGVLPGGRHGPG